MTLVLTHLTDLQRVQAVLSGLSDGVVRVERSATAGFELFDIVRGGVELPIAGGAGQVDDFEFFADVENFYRVVDPSDDSVLESDSITPSLAGLVWLKSIRHPLLNTVVTVSDYGDVEPSNRSGIFPIGGRSLPTAAAELHGGRDHLLDLLTDNDSDDAHLDLMQRTGGVFFIHAPTVAAPGLEGNLLLPGSMYVLVGTPRKTRLGGISNFQRFSLPLTEVNPPGPDVVGGTLTWATVQRLYGSWTGVWAAHSTWRSLWDTIGSPEDPVV